ncbi:MAG: phasin family protein [Bacillota bacterium]|nr:phasin family protein [Bacillota bacterium]
MLEKILSLGFGIVAVSKEQVEKVVAELVKRGEVAPTEAKKMVNEMLERGREERERLGEMVRNQINKTLTELNLVSREEYLTLQQRVQYLEEKLQALEAKDNSQ